ncbi:hypothetical protein PLICRDRAFT_35598 [Plicaturopsis crispa FD-325 SS-3]|nr:hypothetical protein PLICRDRAFT_35598 [Plicaturopsis crispa FD-325 SS-3]
MADIVPRSHPTSRPSTSHQHSGPSNAQKRPAATQNEDNEYVTLPVADPNAWYYPSQGYISDEEPLNPSTKNGNWGKKMTRDARWVRKGKMVAWGPGMEDWQAEERARKRLKLLLPATRRSPSPPSLPHLRSPSPPLESPYPPPNVQHLSFSSYVMDKAVTHSFRSSLLDELEQATNGLIEGEATMRKALGRLWEVIGEDPDKRPSDSFVPKREEEEDMTGEEDERDRRVSRAPDLTPSADKLFLLAYTNGGAPPVFEPSHFSSPEMQRETLEKSLATLRELQDDGREYVERLEEIREGLGDVSAQRDTIWEMVRERALKELQDVALS